MNINNNLLKYDGNICISGLTASGKTTHSHLLTGEFGLTYVSGSQIQLNFLGLSPIQDKDFWISESAKVLWDENQFKRIDEELLRIENISAGYMFDTSTMPWRHKTKALCIWLESDIRSRIIKSFISHRGRNKNSFETYENKINDKDNATISLYKKLYNIDIGSDFSCFDLIIDISSFITEPTLINSLNSISKAHSIIRAAAGYYLTHSDFFKKDLINILDQNKSFIIHNKLI